MADVEGWDAQLPAPGAIELKLPVPDPPTMLGHAVTTWTRQDVERQLIAAFKLLPNCPVHGLGSRIRTPTGGRTPMTEVLQWAALLDDDPDARKYLWTWASCRATGASFVERCRGLGWKQSTAVAGRRRGAERIARALSISIPTTATVLPTSGYHIQGT